MKMKREENSVKELERERYVVWMNAANELKRHLLYFMVAEGEEDA